jgi:DNA-binding SARP family transcriptional activator
MTAGRSAALGADHAVLRVSLLSGFRVTSGDAVLDLPAIAGRLVALLSISRPERLTRSRLAGKLWPDAPEASAVADLRSALWRIRRREPRLLRTSRSSVWLADDVTVDLQDSILVGRQILNDPEAIPDDQLSPATFDADLLPDWDDDWLDVPRERFRQLRLHALEAMSQDLLRRGRMGLAIDVGLAAVAAEPLRETAHECVIRSYLAEGNRAEAVRHFGRFRSLMVEELGLEPSSEIASLVLPASRDVRFRRPRKRDGVVTKR